MSVLPDQADWQTGRRRSMRVALQASVASLESSPPTKCLSSESGMSTGHQRIDDQTADIKLVEHKMPPQVSLESTLAKVRRTSNANCMPASADIAYDDLSDLSEAESLEDPGIDLSLLGNECYTTQALSQASNDENTFFSSINEVKTGRRARSQRKPRDPVVVANVESQDEDQIRKTSKRRMSSANDELSLRPSKVKKVTSAPASMDKALPVEVDSSVCSFSDVKPQPLSRSEIVRRSWIKRRQKLKQSEPDSETPENIIRTSRATRIVVLPISPPETPLQITKAQNSTKAKKLRSSKSNALALRTPSGTGKTKRKAQTPPTSEDGDTPERTAFKRLRISSYAYVPEERIGVGSPRFPPTPESLIISKCDDASASSLLQQVDSALLGLSRKLTHRLPLDDKPLPRGTPDVWADSRQALCETTPYFKMPQSGCHANSGHVYAFLFDGTGHCREYIDTDIIIARAGGGMEADSTGKMVQKKHHSMTDSQVQAVLNDIEHQNPVIIICGNKNAGTLCKIPHRYCVLGWYKPVALWAERTSGKNGKLWTTIKYRFERLNDAKPAWYAPETSLLDIHDYALVANNRLQRLECTVCAMRFPQIYLIGWTCLNFGCRNFWQLADGVSMPCGSLDYNPAFLLDRTPWRNEDEPFNVRPVVPAIKAAMGDNLSYINTRGICCPQCGRCNSRRLFKGWTCDNPDCSYENFPRHIPVTAPLLHNPWENIGDGPSLSQNKYSKTAGIKLTTSYKLGFKLFTYTFEGIEGSFIHAVSNAQINREPGGADDMFAAIQDQEDPNMDLHLERRRFGGDQATNPMPAPKQPQVVLVDSVAILPSQIAHTMYVPHFDHISKTAEVEKDRETEQSGKRNQPILEDGDFMTAFSMNYGMPYKFVASGASLPFEGAPWPVRACRADLNWASQNFLDAAGHTDLNEELIFAYLQGQKIEYHDDGEDGLGPRIATLSLGGKAKMSMRMKRKHYVGCSKTGVLTADRPIPGGLGGVVMDAQRLAAWNELQDLKDKNKPLYEKRRKGLPRELGMYDKRNKLAENLVTITLNHGDIVLMEGYDIQKYLEHKVEPKGHLRFALTCRTVLANHLKLEEKPSYVVGADEEHMSCLRRRAARLDSDA